MIYLEVIKRDKIPRRFERQKIKHVGTYSEWRAGKVTNVLEGVMS